MKKSIFRILLVCSLFIALTGCGASQTSGSTSGNNDPDLGDNTTENGTLSNDIGDAASDVGNAVDDVADGVGNAVDDLVGRNGFNNYSDAHDYFLETMGNYHTDANFELRNENEDLFDYQEGSKGYRFHLYDTSNDSNDMFGEFYVDANSGLIYRVEDNGTISEYPAKNNNTADNNNSTNNNSTNNNNNTTNNSTTNNSTSNNSTSSKTNGLSNR